MAGCLSIHPQGAAIYALGTGTENGAETGAMAWKAGTDCPRVERVSLVVSEAERKRESTDETITERQWERANGDYYEDISPGLWFHICLGFLPHILLKGIFRRQHVLTSRLTLPHA